MIRTPSDPRSRVNICIDTIIRHVYGARLEQHQQRNNTIIAKIDPRENNIIFLNNVRKTTRMYDHTDAHGILN